MNNNLETIVINKWREIDDAQDFMECHVADIRARSKTPENVVPVPLPPKELIIEPNVCAENASDAALIMINILSKNYGTHNIASNALALAENIGSNKVKPFIKFDKDVSPIACAALVKISESEIELGRAACIPGQNGGNGELMIKAFEQWKNNILFPESKILRAEVRTAKATREVPGGQATQAICLGKIGLTPTAIVPMFHHGIPDRQEIFLLASIIKDRERSISEIDKVLPNIIGDKNERKIFEIFWQKFFGKLPNFSDCTFDQVDSNDLEAKISGPIIEIRKSEKPNCVEESINSFFNNDGRFALARISMDLPIEHIFNKSLRLRKIGFRLAGFEPVINDGKISIDILFGKLSEKGKEVMVLPSFTENIFSHREEELLIQSSILWRQN
ncbi:MAG TPA: hypothetical protein VN174_03570 [Candidatus Methanoperedens sp.]|nr:hypothetical protein [Candidatus Methanoperedens sp.]